MEVLATDILKKITSIHTDFEMGSDAAVLTGLAELKEMFSTFCTELDNALDEVQKTIVATIALGKVMELGQRN